MSFKISRRELATSAVGVGAVAASFVATTANAKTMDDVIKDGVLRIGIHPNSPPFSGRDDAGSWKGFDVAFGTRLAEELKIAKVEWVPTETAQRVPFLVADTIDISLGGLTRNSERAKQIEFTFPLHTEVMGVLTTEKETVKSWKDLNDAKYTLVDVRSAWTIDWARRTCRTPRWKSSIRRPTRYERSPRAAPTHSSRCSTSSPPSLPTMPT